MSEKIEAARAQAEAKFKKPYDGSDPGPIQTAQAAEQQAIMEKTARLRALRLAKEEADRSAVSNKSTTKSRLK